MQLYFIRHGESEANLLGEFSNTGCKHPLTPAGVEQARALAQHLAGRPIRRIYASPVRRAVQTGAILSRELGVEVEIAEALREWSVGILEGRRDVDAIRLYRQVQEDWFTYGKLGSMIPEGESFLDILARFGPFIERAMEKHAPAGEDIALVAHGGLYQAMLPMIFNNLPRASLGRWSFPYCAYALAQPDCDGLRCVEWCGSALDRAGSERSAIQGRGKISVGRFT